MKRHQYVAGCVVVMSILFGLGGATNADTLSVAFDAEFEHPPQTGLFRTLLSSITPVPVRTTSTDPAFRSPFPSGAVMTTRAARIMQTRIQPSDRTQSGHWNVFENQAQSGPLNSGNSTSP
jgi:hypothetical protein